MKYDSTKDTKDHINAVSCVLDVFISMIEERKSLHDVSKLHDPEKPYFDEFTPKLKHSTYGSDEYKQFLIELKPALDHHYSKNRHHPEHFKDGINNMTLIDIVEMISDWLAASKRHADGNIYKSLKINRERFEMSDQLYLILKNTVDVLMLQEIS